MTQFRIWSVKGSPRPLVMHVSTQFFLDGQRLTFLYKFCRASKNWSAPPVWVMMEKWENEQKTNRRNMFRVSFFQLCQPVLPVLDFFPPSALEDNISSTQPPSYWVSVGGVPYSNALRRD